MSNNLLTPQEVALRLKVSVKVEESARNAMQKLDDMLAVLLAVSLNSPNSSPADVQSRAF